MLGISFAMWPMYYTFINFIKRSKNALFLVITYTSLAILQAQIIVAWNLIKRPCIPHNSFLSDRKLRKKWNTTETVKHRIAWSHLKLLQSYIFCIKKYQKFQIYNRTLLCPKGTSANLKVIFYATGTALNKINAKWYEN